MPLSQTDDTAPHTAVVRIYVEVHEKLPTGELSGRICEKRDPVILAVEGSDKFICTRRLNEMMEDVKKWSRRT